MKMVRIAAIAKVLGIASAAVVVAREGVKGMIFTAKLLKRARTVDWDSPEFKGWFSDSKVVNPDGTPRVMYHGAALGADFEEFKHKEGFPDGGYFFTSKLRTATNYARGEEDNVLHTYLRIVKPKYYDNSEWEKWDSFYHRNRVEHEALGHDGIIVTNGDDEHVIAIVFDPTQIKSATNNRGSYCGYDPNFYK